ncbi:hypothetical protein A2U01_0006461, partial [Trifolium medium]|nr:hypothetical protein [Trifolium medium]
VQSGSILAALYLQILVLIQLKQESIENPIILGFAKSLEKKEGTCNFCYLLESWSCKARS